MGAGVVTFVFTAIFLWPTSAPRALRTRWSSDLYKRPDRSRAAHAVRSCWPRGLVIVGMSEMLWHTRIRSRQTLILALLRASGKREKDPARISGGARSLPD